MDLQERNFTIEWVRQADEIENGRTTGVAMEEIISVASSRTGLKVENDHVSYYYESESDVGVYVKSVLSFDFTISPTANISGRYWCRVLEKTLDSYTYSVAGRSATETLITDRAHEDLLPPCVSEATYYQPEFKCVHDRNGGTAPNPGSLSPPEGGSLPTCEWTNVCMSSRVVGAMAVTGVTLITTTTLVVVMVMRCTCGPTAKREECRSPHLKPSTGFI